MSTSRIIEGDITTYPTDIKSIIKEYYEQLYADEFNLHMDKSLERHKLRKQTQEKSGKSK